MDNDFPKVRGSGEGGVRGGGGMKKSRPSTREKLKRLGVDMDARFPLKKRNFVVDVAFTVEGPWANENDIPYEALIAGMERRLEQLRKHEEVTAPTVYHIVPATALHEMKRLMKKFPIFPRG